MVFSVPEQGPASGGLLAVEESIAKGGSAVADLAPDAVAGDQAIGEQDVQVRGRGRRADASGPGDARSAGGLAELPED